MQPTSLGALLRTSSTVGCAGQKPTPSHSAWTDEGGHYLLEGIILLDPSSSTTGRPMMFRLLVQLIMVYLFYIRRSAFGGWGCLGFLSFLFFVACVVVLVCASPSVLFLYTLGIIPKCIAVILILFS